MDSAIASSTQIFSETFGDKESPAIILPNVGHAISPRIYDLLINNINDFIKQHEH